MVSLQNVVVQKITDDRSLQSGILKNMEESDRKKLQEILKVNDGDLVFLSAGFSFNPVSGVINFLKHQYLNNDGIYCMAN